MTTTLTPTRCACRRILWCSALNRRSLGAPHEPATTTSTAAQATCSPDTPGGEVFPHLQSVCRGGGSSRAWHRLCSARSLASPRLSSDTVIGGNNNRFYQSSCVDRHPRGGPGVGGGSPTPRSVANRRRGDRDENGDRNNFDRCAQAAFSAPARHRSPCAVVAAMPCTAGTRTRFRTGFRTRFGAACSPPRCRAPR